MWQPIETAPRDATAIMVMRDIWAGTRSGRAEECNGHNTYVAAWWPEERGGQGAWICYTDTALDPECPVEPTHWMPLPDPPGAPPAPSVPREAIDKMLTQLMDIAVSNGANSVSMPDEYVEVAAWLCGIPAQPESSDWPMLHDGHLRALCFAYEKGFAAGVDERNTINAFGASGSQAAAFDVGLECGRAAQSRAQPAPSIPEGWRFYLADFSGHAAGRFDLGNAVLIRDPAGRNAWNALSDADQDKVPLYMTGKGRTVQEAIEHACRKAAGLEAKCPDQ